MNEKDETDGRDEVSGIAGDQSGIAFDSVVDARGLNCPLPILKAKKALSTIQSGQVLKVVATDPGSKRDFEAFARQTGNVLVEQFETSEVRADRAVATWTFFLQRR